MKILSNVPPFSGAYPSKAVALPAPQNLALITKIIMTALLMQRVSGGNCGTVSTGSWFQTQFYQSGGASLQVNYDSGNVGVKTIDDAVKSCGFASLNETVAGTFSSVETCIC